MRGDKAGVAHVAVRYKQGSTTVAEAIATITVDAAAGSLVAAVVLEPVTAEITLPANIQYVAHLFTAQGTEFTAASDGGSLQYAAAQPSILLVDPATGLAIGSGVGVTTVTASYVRNGAVVKASLPSEAKVYAAGTQGHYASVTMSAPNETRVIKVGQAPMTFQVIIKDQAGSQVKANIGGGVDVTTSDPDLVTAYQPAIPGGVFYTMQATKLPAASAVAGIPNVVLLKIDIFGAMITIPMLVVP